MPTAARGLKQYRCGTLSSKIRDNEHSAASLGDSEVSSIKSSPANVTRPEFVKATEDCCEISATVGGKKPRHVFEHSKSRSQFVNDSYGLMEQPAPSPGQALALPGNRQVLARAAEGDDIHGREVVPAALPHVGEVERVGQVPPQHPLGVRVNLHGPNRADSGRGEPRREATDAGKKLPVSDLSHPLPPLRLP
jgi:hypothetical protein